MYRDYDHMDMGWGGWVAMTLALLIGLGLLAVLVVTLMRSPRTASGPSLAPPAPTGPSMAQITLDERYARGEIDEEEYLRRKRILRSD